MATVIGFDTATDDTVVAAVSDGEVVFSRSVGMAGNGRPAHASRLLVEVEAAAAAAGGWEKVGRVAVGVGPGSFTGLRIGVSTAKALVQALGIELAPVGTLASLARGAAGLAGGRPLVAALDARRAELFASLYDGAGRQLAEPFVAAPGELADRLSQLPESPLAVGSGALRFRDELQESGAEVPGDSHPSHRVAGAEICALGAAVAVADPDTVTPIYLRPPDAERWRERDSTES
jgi:tRNA threonylcarbamoyladenosine biosynthesis protein TsaB